MKCKDIVNFVSHADIIALRDKLSDLDFIDEDEIVVTRDNYKEMEELYQQEYKKTFGQKFVRNSRVPG